MPLTYNPPRVEVGLKSVNVTKYGLSGVGAIASAIAEAIASGARRVYIPPGTFDISAPIKPNAGQIEFFGESRSTSIIRQLTADTPVFQWENSTVGDKHSITVKSMYLKNANLPTISTTQQYGIQFRSDAAGTAVDGSGYYLSRFEDLRIDNSYVGVGQYVSGAGTCFLWGNVYRDLLFFDTIHNAIKMRGGSGGQPMDVLDNVHVLNYSIGAITDDYAIDAAGANGLLINGLNVEDWRNKIIWCDGMSTGVINGLRTERIVIDNNSFPRMIGLNNGNYVLNGADLDLVVKHASGYARLIFAAGAAQVSARAINAHKNPSGSTTTTGIQLLGGDSTSTIDYSAISVDSAVAKYLPSVWGTDMYSRKREDGQAPEVDVLPSASATYRGREFRVLGGAGAADVTSRCRKNAADAYEWVAI